MSFSKPVFFSAALPILLCSFQGQAEVTANLGVVSEYHFRGIAQTRDASASAGLDYADGNLSLGTWVADVNDGVEVDFYGAYQWQLSKQLSTSLGFTSYQYTGDFDSAYNELNLVFNYSFLSLELTQGQREKDSKLNILEQDYRFVAITAEHNGFYATYGSFGDDADGDYFEAGYQQQVSGFDLGLSLIVSDKDLDDDETLVFSISRTFEL